VTFTGDSIPKIIAGRKCGTTRLPSRMWTRVVHDLEDGRLVDAHIYQGNPRNGGQLLYKAPFVRGVLCTGASFDGEMILKDGFDTVEELAMRLWKHYSRGRVRPPQAVAWFRKQTWTWFEWGEPPAVDIRQEELVRVPLLTVA